MQPQMFSHGCSKNRQAAYVISVFHHLLSRLLPNFGQKLNLLGQHFLPFPPPRDVEMVMVHMWFRTKKTKI